MNPELIKEIGDWVTETGLNGTTTSNYHVYFVEIADVFNIDVALVKENADVISEHIDHLLDIEVEEDCFNMIFEGEECCKHCSGYEKRCYEECCNCDIWCDEMDENYEPPVIKEFDASERENLKVGDIAYCSYINKVGTITEINNGYCIDGWGALFSEKFIRKANESEIKWYNAEIAARKWLKDRQDELAKLSFRRFDTDLFREQRELLEEAGYFVYDLRDWDEGNGFNIEHHVGVNHIGCWVTDMDLTPYMNEDRWIGIDELKKANIEELYCKEIDELLYKGKELHFNR